MRPYDDGLGVMLDVLLRRGDGPKKVAQAVLNDSMNRFLSAYHQTVMVLEVAKKLSREEAEALVQEVVSEKRASWEAECLDKVAVGLLPFLMRLK